MIVPAAGLIVFLCGVARGGAAEKEVVPAYLNPAMQHATIEYSEPGRYMTICPSVCELEDGSLLAVYHRTSKVDWYGGYSTWSRISRDGGKSWGEAQLIDSKMQAPGLVRLRSGDLLLCGGEALTKRSTTMKLFRSRDRGKTWEKQQPIWSKSEGMKLQGGCGSLIRLTSGRVVCPCHGGPAGNYDSRFEAWCYFSDDDGKTWKASRKHVRLSKRGAMEPSICELKDGSLLMSLRTQLGAIYLSRSKDGGQTWSEARSSGLEAPEAPFAMSVFPGTDHVLMVYCSGKFDPNHRHSGERTPLSTAMSLDGGRTWRTIGTIAGGEHEFGAAGTSSICFTSTGKVVMAYDWTRDAWKRDGAAGGTCVAIAGKQWFFSK